MQKPKVVTSLRSSGAKRSVTEKKCMRSHVVEQKPPPPLAIFSSTIPSIISFAHTQFRLLLLLNVGVGLSVPLFRKTLPHEKVNMIMATMVESVAKGLCLSESLGLHNEALIEVITIEPCHGM